MALLLIEDDKKIATVVKRGLEGEGYRVEVCFDCAEGLWMATEGVYDLIVLDVMPPSSVYIRRLSAAIDEPYGRHPIETVRGAGYRLNSDGG